MTHEKVRGDGENAGDRLGGCCSTDDCQVGKFASRTSPSELGLGKCLKLDQMILHIRTSQFQRKSPRYSNK